MSSSKANVRQTVAVFLFALAVRLACAWSVHGNSFVDVASFESWAAALDTGTNPYSEAAANYPPLWIVICWCCLQLEQAVGGSFDWYVKLLNSFSDALICAAIARSGGWSHEQIRSKTGIKSTPTTRPRLFGFAGGEAHSTLWALGYAINPVSILITSFHGQNEPVALCLAVWSILWLWEAGLLKRSSSTSARVRLPNSGRLIGSALLFGMSLLIKPIALILLPVILLRFRNLKAAGYWLFVVAFISLLVWLPVVWHSSGSAFTAVTSYGSPTDFGAIGIFNSWMNLGRSSAGVKVLENVPLEWKLVAALAALVYLCGARRTDFFRAVCGMILVIYLSYGGLGANYLMWIIPFAALARQSGIWQHTILGAATLLAFFQLHHPALLTGDPAEMVPLGISIPQWSGLFFFFQVLLFVHWGRWFADYWRTRASVGMDPG